MAAEIGRSIRKAVELLNKDELVAIPTETVYGLAGNGLSSKAVSKIFAVKNRPHFDPLILHTDKLSKIEDHISGTIPKPLQKLAETFMPGPLSILLKKNKTIPDITTSGLDTVAIRIPEHPLTLKLLSKLEFPLAAPSANPFGYISPTKPSHVFDQLGQSIPYILNGGNCKIGIESTIVAWQNEEVVVLRKGSTAIESIKKVVGQVKINPLSSSNPEAPGMLKSHYAPNIQMKLVPVEIILKTYMAEEVGHIAWSKKNKLLPSQNQIVLTKNNDFSEAARNLFSALRTLDQLSLKVIVTTLVPDQGLGRAINDKLRRAAG